MRFFVVIYRTTNNPLPRHRIGKATERLLSSMNLVNARTNETAKELARHLCCGESCTPHDLCNGVE